MQVNIDRIIHVANRLREMQNFDTELVDRLAAKLESEWNKLYTAVERRSTMLEASVSFHRSSEQVNYFMRYFSNLVCLGFYELIILLFLNTLSLLSLSSLFQSTCIDFQRSSTL